MNYKNLIAPIVLILLLSACEQPEPEVLITPVKVITITTLNADKSLSYSGQIEPDTSLELSFRTDGYIVDITSRTGASGKPRPLQPGDSVTAGEVLARIDDQQYRDRLTTAQANLDKALAAQSKAKEDFARATALKAKQSITEPDFDAAQQEIATATASVDGTRAQRDEANNKLAETALIAPQNALINKRNIELGTLVRSGTVGFELANTNFVKVVFGIPEQVLSKVTLGDEIGVRVVSVSGRVFAGTVTQIAPVANQRTRMFEVTVSVDNSDGVLQQGMIATVDVSLEQGRGQIVRIPLDSIVRSADGRFAVYVIKQAADATRVELTTIETSEVLGNQVMVTSGLNPGQEIVVKGTAQISDGQTVNVLR